MSLRWSPSWSSGKWRSVTTTRKGSFGFMEGAIWRVLSTTHGSHSTLLIVGIGLKKSRHKPPNPININSQQSCVASQDSSPISTSDLNYLFGAPQTLGQVTCWNRGSFTKVWGGIGKSPNFPDITTKPFIYQHSTKLCSFTRIKPNFNKWPQLPFWGTPNLGPGHLLKSWFFH